MLPWQPNQEADHHNFGYSGLLLLTDEQKVIIMVLYGSPELIFAYFILKCHISRLLLRFFV